MRMEDQERADAAIAAELVRRIRLGDRAAEGEMFERYSRGVLQHLRRMTGDPARSDDLHQETFRIVLLRLRAEGLEEPEKLPRFVLRTARNLFLSQRRKQVRRGEDQEPVDVDLPDPQPGQLERVLEEEEADAVKRLLGELGADRDREILLRFYLAEENKERICDDFALSSLQFNRVLHRARQRFRELLLSRGFDPLRQSSASRQDL
jgi:RNA polymerase sigma-70 factor (ECF subfamily)